MSAETIEWLNTKTLVGCVQARQAAGKGQAWYRKDGMAWHYNEAKQGEESNHYDGFIPVSDVERRLFNWEAVEGAVSASVLSHEGVLTVTDPSRKAIVRPAEALGPEDKGGILGIFKSSYTIHQYREWLLDNVASIIDADLGIGSAGLLRNGAQGYVSIEIPEVLTTPSGFQYRPNLLAVTSLDGSLATSYKRVVTAVCCDNSMSAALREQGQTYKVKHSKYSGMRLLEARQALEIVHSISDEFSAQVEELTNTTVTDAQWELFLDSIQPLKDGNGTLKEGLSFTVAENTRNAIDDMYRTDARCKQWQGTAWGVVQTMNTFEHWGTRVKGGESQRHEKNTLRMVKGDVDKLDMLTMKNLQACGVGE